MQVHELNFLPRRTLVTPLGMVLLLVGLVLVSSTVFEVLECQDQNLNSKGKLAQLSSRVAELRGVKVEKIRTVSRNAGTGNSSEELESRRTAEAQKVIRALAAPWNEIFDALEKSHDDTVALLSITPERSSGRLAITGEAKNYEALTAYLSRLNESDGLSNAQLITHEIKGNERYVVFSAIASFSK